MLDGDDGGLACPCRISANSTSRLEGYRKSNIRLRECKDNANSNKGPDARARGRDGLERTPWTCALLCCCAVVLPLPIGLPAPRAPYGVEVIKQCINDNTQRLAWQKRQPSRCRGGPLRRTALKPGKARPNLHLIHTSMQYLFGLPSDIHCSWNPSPASMFTSVFIALPRLRQVCL